VLMHIWWQVTRARHESFIRYKRQQGRQSYGLGNKAICNDHLKKHSCHGWGDLSIVPRRHTLGNAESARTKEEFNSELWVAMWHWR